MPKHTTIIAELENLPKTNAAEYSGRRLIEPFCALAVNLLSEPMLFDRRLVGETPNNFLVTEMRRTRSSNK